MKKIKQNILLFDYINLGFYILMLIVTLTHYSIIPNPFLVIFMYTTIILTSLFIIGNSNNNSLLRFLRYFYPYMFVGFIFESLGSIVPFINPHDKDHILIHLDRLILGNDAALIFNFLNVKGVVDYLQLAYTSYYFLPLFIIIYLYKRNNLKELDYTLFALSIGYYVSYIGYMLVPAIGPRYNFAYLSKIPLKGGLIFQVVNPFLNSLEHIKQDCFPSGHTEISLLVFLLFMDINKKIALLVLPIVLSLIIATMVLRYHYFTDVIAGGIISFLVYFLSRTIYFPKKK